MSEPRLTDDEIEQWLRSNSTWSRHGDQIRKHFERASFADAISFVVRVGFLAEAANHHPDLDIRWRNVVVTLSTHDAGGITALDLAIAERIEEATA